MADAPANRSIEFIEAKKIYTGGIVDHEDFKKQNLS
jgi:hypothetical protein